MGIVCALLAAKKKKMHLVGSNQVVAREKTSHSSNHCCFVRVCSVAKTVDQTRVAAYKELIEVSVQVMAWSVQNF